MKFSSPMLHGSNTHSSQSPRRFDLPPMSQRLVVAAQDARAVRMVGRKVFL
jgi:6-phosphogluconolactonase (cycloisomerase 2 family)